MVIMLILIMGIVIVAAIIAGIFIYQKISRLVEAKKALKSVFKNYLEAAQASGQCKVIKFDDLEKMSK